jgi:CBS domain-containing protein
MERAAQIMWEGDCGCVPIVDARRNVQGMITDRDLCMAAYTRGQALSSMSVAQAMSDGVVCCRTEDDVEDALKRMAESQLHRLPVVDEGNQLAGMLSMADILQSRLRRKHAEEMLETMVALTRPRRAHEVQEPAKRVSVGAGA